MNRVLNAKTLPKVYFGLHMVEGVAEYRAPDAEPYRIFIGENTIKNMDETFQGRPVYVQHVDEVKLDKLQEEADGYVVRSFFNKSDGKHWCEFIVVSDEGHEAIKKRWKLSNAYVPHGTFGRGGHWHGVQYEKEILGGEYEHLAIVPNPRYEESVIMTPEEFKAYNNEKEIELKRIANSKTKGDTKMKFNLFKKTKLENAGDLNLEETLVELPKSKKQISLANAIEIADKVENMSGYADGAHMVKVGEDEMSVNDLVKKHMDVNNEMSEMKKKNAGGEGEDADLESMDNEEDEDKKDDADKDDKKENGEDEADKEKADKKDDKKSNAADDKKKADDLKAQKKANFEKLKNAESTVHNEVVHIELSEDKVARGKSRYGSAV